MFRLLSQPYPTEETIRQRFVKALIASVFVGAFLLLFQPFGLDDWQTPAKTLKIMGFGLVTFVVMMVDSFLIPPLFPRYFSDSHWTVGREIIRTILFILVIAVGNRVYLGWLMGGSSTAYDWLQMIWMTFVIGIFPTIGIVLVSYIVQLRRYSQAAAELPHYSALLTQQQSPLREQVSVVRADNRPDTRLTLIADNEKDTLTLQPDSLLFIESSDNYCTVVYLKCNPSGTDQPVKPLLRSSLSRLEAQITGEPDPGGSGTGKFGSGPSASRPHIVRCHRSYIVNLDRVERVTGNAQGYKLHLLGGQFQVPVARRFNDSLIHQLKSLT